MQTKFIAIGLAFLFLTPSISSEINIDGILDEEEWKSARIFKNFYEVYPYSLKEVKDIETEILILESNKGIYFGFKNFSVKLTFIGIFASVLLVQLSFSFIKKKLVEKFDEQKLYQFKTFFEITLILLILYFVLF